MRRITPLLLVAAADVARTVLVVNALITAEGAGTPSPWLGAGVMLASGALSIAMLGIAMRSVIGFGDQPAPQ
jgi:hypothetical protein